MVNAKEAAGRAAVDALVKDGMKIGLGTGSTAICAVRYIGALINEGKLKNILAVPTSFQTSIECEKLGIPLYSLNSKQIAGRLDLSIDGADEVDGENRLIKGGGAAHLLEKIVAYSSSAYAVVVDESKIVKTLGLNFPVPLELVPEARMSVSLALQKFGCEAVIREAVRKAGPVISDHGNLIFDLHFKTPFDPSSLEYELNRIPGIVENGLFANFPDYNIHPVIFIAHADGTVIRRD